jgi:thiol:disulfide interchange protein DsbC
MSVKGCEIPVPFSFRRGRARVGAVLGYVLFFGSIKEEVSTMNGFSRRRRHLLLALALFLAWPAAVLAQCPGKEDVEKAIEPFSRGEKLEIKKLSPSPLKGLCEVQFKGNRGIGVVYIDENGAFIFSGDIIDVKNRKMLTRDLLAELNAPLPLTAAEMQKAAALAAVTFGKGEKTVYFVTDPM